MTNIILVALMQVSAVGADQGNFDQAYHRSLTTGRPLVVLIGAVWCPGCQTMKNSILPQVAEAGGLENVVFIYVDFDQQRQLALRLRRATSIPQLLRFDRTPTGWKSKCLVGAKSPREVYDFINAGLVEETKISEVSATEGPRNESGASGSAETARSRAAASESRTNSSVDVPRPRQREVHSLPAGKASGFPYYWMMFLNKLSPKGRNRDNSTAYQGDQAGVKRR